jgi:hypothetical protein
VFIVDEYYKEQITIDGNGEIIGKKVRKYYNPFRDGRGYNFKYKSIYIKSYLDVPLPECFTDTEVGRIYRLSRYIYSDSNLLAKRSSNAFVPITKQDIRKVFVVRKSVFYPFWKKMIDEKILKAIQLDGQEYYCFNPIYFNSTHYLPIYLYIAFQDELGKHLPEWVVKKYLEMQEGKRTETLSGS